MKSVLAFILFVLSFGYAHAYSYSYDTNKLSVIMGQLGMPKQIISQQEDKFSSPFYKEIGFRLIGPNSIWVLVNVADEFENREGPTKYTIYILLTDTEGNILSRHKEHKKYERNIVGVKINLDYYLDARTQVFGVILRTERAFKSDGNRMEYLNFFVAEGKTLRPVLYEFPVYEDKYVMSGVCKGTWDESNTTLVMSNKKNNRYYNIITETFTEHHINDGIADVDKDGKPVSCKDTVTRDYTSGILTYDGKVYRNSTLQK